MLGHSIDNFGRDAWTLGIRSMPGRSASAHLPHPPLRLHYYYTTTNTYKRHLNQKELWTNSSSQKPIRRLH